MKENKKNKEMKDVVATIMMFVIGFIVLVSSAIFAATHIQNKKEQRKQEQEIINQQVEDTHREYVLIMGKHH